MFSDEAQLRIREAEHLVIEAQRTAALDPETTEGIGVLLLEARSKISDALLSLRELEQRLLRITPS